MEKGKVLVVDDESCIREVLERFLIHRGYSVVTAKNGTEALEKFKAEQPSLVLLDIVMRGLGGTEVLQKLKELDPEVRVIMITAVQDNEIGKFSLTHGASDFITKPINLDCLDKNLIIHDVYHN